jgi:acylpyruvate hydrolase
MRLATLDRGGRTAAVVLDDGHAVEIRDAGGSAYADVGALLADATGLQRAREAAAGGGGEPYAAADLRRPILAPGAVFCVGLNYATHIREMGRDLPEHPTLFSKLSRALTDPFADIPLPRHSVKVDYEGELAAVIGRGGRDIDAADAWSHVAGVTVLNDVTMRDYQRRTVQWFAGKTWEGSTPFGPDIVTLDEVGDLGARELLVRVNGQERQRSKLDDLVFDVPTLVADISRIVTLQPGDIIATGTPGGVGVAMDPQSFLSDGDEVEVEISGIGTIRNRFRGAS